MEDWARVRKLFEELVDLPEAEQQARLRIGCSADPELRGRVETLLAAERQEAALDAELPAVDASPLQAEALVGQQIAGFEVLGSLGQGGMGVVLRARQQQPEREVALKMLAAPLSSEAERARFAFEVETLGRLRHPGIAQVFDAGTWTDPATGRALPWFAMELVPAARPLDRYAAEQQLDLRGRLGLLVEVAEAVQFGHARGVLHRDLKPDNILVDGEGRPKVIDFGTARSTDPGGTRYTMAGMVLGTPAYMSPEQFEGDPALVDAQADVYALGVVLYQLLTGRLPFDPEGEAWTQFITRVRRDEAAAPSAQDPSLPRELDWICAAALAKQRGERYPTVAALSADLQRFLADEPVSVGPVSATLALRRFVRRNRALVYGGVAVGVTLLVGAVVAGIGWWQASENEAQARSEARAQAAALRWFSEMARHARPSEAGRQVTLLQVLDNAVGDLETLRQEPAVVDVTVRNAIAATFLSLELPKRSLEILDAGRARAERELGPLHSASLLLAYLRGWALGNLSQHDAALVALRRSLAGRSEVFGPRSKEVGEVAFHLGHVLGEKGDYAAAREQMSTACEVLEASHGPNHRYSLRARGTLAILMGQAGEPERALDLLSKVRQRAERALGPDHDSVLTLVGNEAVMLSEQGQTAAAVPLYERVLAHKQESYGAQSPAVLKLLSNLAGARTQLGQIDEAEKLLRKVVALHDQNQREPLQALIARNNLASTLRRGGRAADALPVYVDVLARTEKLLGTGHWIHALFRAGYGAALSAVRDFATAERELLAALEILHGQFGDGHMRTRSALEHVVGLYQAWGKPDKAAAYQRRLEAKGG